MAFCTNCGTKIKGNSRFCPECGALVEENQQTAGTSAAGPGQNAADSALEKARSMARRGADAAASAMEKAGPVVKRGADAAASAMEKAGPAVKRGADAAASAMEKAGPAAKRGADAAASAMEKASPKLRRNMKIICIAALAVVVLVLIFSRRTGGKEDSFLDQFQGNWELAGMYVNMFTSPATPRSVSITENALHIGTNYKPNPTLAIPLSETEYKDGALCFTSQIYNTSGTAVYEAGLQDYNMRLTYDESEEGLVLEYELSVDNELGWYKLVWYKSVE